MQDLAPVLHNLTREVQAMGAVISQLQSGIVQGAPEVTSPSTGWGQAGDSAMAG